MIKANELRIGNAIWDDTRNKVKWVNHRVISDLASHANPLPYSPIPLNPEWLERLGFVKEVNNIWLNSPLKVGINAGGSVSWVYYFDRHLSLNRLLYVHQLQNLYFALTGEELTIKN